MPEPPSSRYSTSSLGSVSAVACMNHQNSASPSNVGTVFNTAANTPVGQSASIGAQHPTVQTPYRQTYSTARLDYSGPFGGHYFARGNYNVDSTLLLLVAPPPPGTVYAGWNAAALQSGDPIVSISHPSGDTAR